MRDQDGSVINSLGLEIFTDESDAISGIDQTIQALEMLKSAAMNMQSAVNNISNLASSLKTLSTVKIPNALPNQVAKLSAAMNGVGAKGLSDIKGMTDAMSDMSTSTSQIQMAEVFEGTDRAAESVKKLDDRFSQLRFKDYIDVSPILYANKGLAEMIDKLIEIKTLTKSLEIAPVVNNAPRLPEYSQASLPQEVQAAPFGLSQIALPAKSQADAMKILQETAVSFEHIYDYQTKINTQDIVNLTSLKTANREVSDLEKKLLKLQGTAGVRVLDNQPFDADWDKPLAPIQARSPRYYSGQMYGSAIGPQPDYVRGKSMIGVEDDSRSIDKLSQSLPLLTARLVAVSGEARQTKKSLEEVADTPFKKSVKDFGEGLKSLGKKLVGANSALGRLGKSIKRIAVYRAIRGALKAITNGFKEGTSNLYKWSDAFDNTREFANSMDRISTAVLYLKNSLGALVAPIVNAVAPAFDYFIDKIVSAINWLNELISALTGAATFTVAKKIGTKFEDIADGAGKASKAIKSFTIGIDELNIIEDNKGSGSGVGGLNDVAEDWFEKKDVSSSMREFADNIREITKEVSGYFEWMYDNVKFAWDNLWEFDWKGWAEWAFSWEGVTETWSAFVEKLKGVWEWVKKVWDKLSKIKESLGTAGDTLDTFFRTITKGNPFFDAINGFLDLKTSADNFRKSIKKVTTGVQNLFNLIKDLFTGNWDFNALFGGIQTLIKTDGGRSMAGALAQFTVQELGNVIPGAELVNFARSILNKLGINIGKQKDVVRPYAYSVGANIIDGIKQGASANTSSLYSKIGSIGSSALSTFKSNASYSSFKSAGENIVDGIIAGLDSKKGKIYNSISVMASKTGSSFNYTLKIHSPSKFFMESGKYIDEGLALGIDNNAYKVENSVSKLSKQFTDFRPTIDTSNLALPDAQNFTSDIQGRIKSNATVSVQNQTDAMERFLTETLMPVVTRIADDTKRTADKDANIYMDGRKVTSTINRQNRNNGFSFT